MLQRPPPSRRKRNSKRKGKRRRGPSSAHARAQHEHEVRELTGAKWFPVVFTRDEIAKACRLGFVDLDKCHDKAALAQGVKLMLASIVAPVIQSDDPFDLA